MSKKEKIKKIILISLCAVIIVIIMIRNVMGGIGKVPSEDVKISYEEAEGISKAEAYRLFGYLRYSDKGSVFQSTGEEYLTCGEFRDLIIDICEEREIDYKKLIENLPKRLSSVKREEDIYLTEFLFVYERMVEMINEQIESADGTIALEFKELYFLGTQLSEEESKNQMIDKMGESYYYSGSKDYSEIFSVIDKEDSSSEGENADFSEEDNVKTDDKAKTDDNAKTTDKAKTDASDNSGSNANVENQVDSSNEDDKTDKYKNIESYIDVPLKVLVYNDSIIYIRDIFDESVTLSNVYMMEGKDSTLKIFVAGIEKSYETIKPLSSEIKEKVGDVTVEGGIITGVIVKPDVINGKVLETSKQDIEIEGYGKLPFDENFKIYKVYDTISMEQTSSILVGYTITDFVVSDGIVCAALIKESIKAENIRVLISTDNYKSYYHKSVTVTSKDDFIVAYGEQKKLYEAGEKVTIKTKDERFESGRIKIISTKEDGKIKITSIERSYGKPEYRGSLEISEKGNGLTIVNELSLEVYLYSVVPSEMPISYGTEALKVQAVCARSFAYNQLLDNKYSEYGAHVDDSVNSQVYNNVKESEESILAVKDSYGQVLSYKNKVLTTYYFSTSCGHTASIEDVWANGVSTTYLQGSLQTEKKEKVDLSSEENFKDFIDNEKVEVKLKKGTITENVETFDNEYLMYRWHVTISAEDLSKQINENLQACYETSKNLILTLTSKKNEDNLVDGDGVSIVNGAVYQSIPVSNIGTVKSMKVISRGESGIIKDLLIKGTKSTILVRYQTNIRKLLAPVSDDLYRLDGSVMSGMTMLPSAFFYIEMKDENGKSSDTDFTLVGGGYGHGVGMSQNGVKTMTSEGKTYEEVLEYFYTGITLSFVYE